MPDQHSDFSTILGGLVKESRLMLDSFQIVSRTSGLKLTGLVLLNEIVRKAESVHHLFDSKNYAGIEIIVRSALENYVDVENLFRYPDTYIYYMQFLSLEHQRKSLQSAVNNPSSPFSQSLSELAPAEMGAPLGEMLSRTKNELEDVKTLLTRQYIKGKRRASESGATVDTRARHRFVLSDSVDEYEAMYGALSAAVHGRISSMLNGVVLGERIVWPPEEAAPPYKEIDLMSIIVYLSCYRVGRKYRRPVTKLNNLRKERDLVLRTHWGPFDI